MKIFVHTIFNDTEKAYFRQNLPTRYELCFGSELSEENRKEAFLSSDLCLGNIPLAWAQATTSLQWLQLHSAGLDPYQQLTLPAFPITNLKGFFGQSVAETAVAGIMAMYRGIDRLARWQTTEKWVGTPMRASLHLLENAKVGILGGGAIGLKTAKILTGFDCDIKIFSRTAKGDSILDINTLGQFLPDLDILVACLPETQETIGLINKSLLELLKPSALFVNVGRGSAVDEEALIDILQENKIFGAVLDVTATEPLPPHHVLWQMPNVLLTQHTSGGWAEENLNKINFFLENLQRFEKGEPLLNMANLERGY